MTAAPKTTLLLSLLLALTTKTACGVDRDVPADTGSDRGDLGFDLQFGVPEGDIDCSDPSENPLLGTCVEDFFDGCFNPLGDCTVQVSVGGFNATWSNGAVSRMSGNPATHTFNITVVNSDGVTCATGSLVFPHEQCEAYWTYTLVHTDESLVYCPRADGTATVACADGSYLEIGEDDRLGADSCEYGSTGLGECEVFGP